MLSSGSLSFSLLQIESLIHSSGKKNHRANFNEVNQLVEVYKIDAGFHFIRCLFSSVDFSPYEPKTGQKDFHQAHHLSQEFNLILAKPNFPSLLCYAIDRPLPSSKGFGPSRQLLPQITRVLKLDRVQEVVMGLALTQSSNAQLAYYAQQWVRQKLPELVRAHITETESSEPGVSAGISESEVTSATRTTTRVTVPGGFILRGVSIEIMHYLLSHLLEDSDHCGLTDQLLSSLLAGFRLEFPSSRTPVCLSALLHPDIAEFSPVRALCPNTSPTLYTTTATTSKPLHTGGELRSRIGADGSDRSSNGHDSCMDLPSSDAYTPDPGLLADLLEELGPACTSNLDTMRLTLAEFGQHELTPSVVAKCLCLFMRTADIEADDRTYRKLDPLDTDTLIILRAGSSGALWREVRTIGSTSDNDDIFLQKQQQQPMRPSSLLVSKPVCDRPTTLNSLSASEPRLNQIDSQASEMSFTSRPNELVSVSPRWNIENFLTVVAEINSNLDMDKVFAELDCPEFFVSSRSAFVLLKQFLFFGDRSGWTEALFYRPWIHAHGQLSLLRHSYAHPDVICLAYYPYRCVDLSNYRLAQTEDQPGTLIWKNVDYVETLLSLSERGVFHEVYGLLEQAFTLCPTIVTATLLETRPTPLRSVMLGHAFVYFLSPRPNSQVILQSAWNSTATNRLSSSDLQQQRCLLLAAIQEYASQLTTGIAEPSTLSRMPHISNGSVTNTNNNNNLTRLVELLASVSDSTSIVGDESNNHKGHSVLAVLLGTTESPSNAVSSLLSLTVPSTITTSGSAVSNLISISLLPTPSQAIDLALVLLLRIANVVSRAAAASRSATSADAVLNPAMLADLQTAMKLFLVGWFTECMRDKEFADSFAYGIVDYLYTRYAPQVLGCTVPSSASKNASSIAILPGDLRRPSSALLTHIIRSAQAALKSPTCSLRATVINEVNQAFTLFLQNLAHSAIPSTNTTANIIPQSNNRAGSLGQSAFNLTMKPGTGPSGHQSQPQTRNAMASSSLSSGTNVHHYQPPNLSTAAALAAVSSFGSTSDDFSRSTSVNALTSRLSQTNLTQHASSSLPTQALLSGSLSSPLDHAPVALSFSSEPLEIEMTKEAEAEANTFFQKLLKGISTPEEMFKTVYDYATQGNLAQRKLLDGILRMLADEVSRYLQDYPEPMLPLIADLYGSILAASTHVVSLRALSMLWRALLSRLYVLPPETSLDSPVFRAVVLILIKAKNTFTQFFNLPSCLVGCPVFKLFPHELQEYLLNAEIVAKNYIHSRQSTTSGSKPGQLHGPHQALSGSTPGSSTQLSSLTFSAAPPTQSELMVKPPDPPEEAVSDRIYFLFNNVSKTNVREKSTELAELLSTDERIQPWFAFYLVGKRVPVEHTFHDLFAIVLDYIQEKVPNVRPKVMQELMRNIKLLLRNIRLDRDDMQARSTLKNLGSFLGLITLARNKPLLHDDLNVKDLIYEAYHKGPIPTQYVVPFVARVLRGATESLVFQPPNPWTMAVLKVFRELYDMRDVKDCLRFEIEIVCRSFKLNLDEIPIAYFLRDPSHFANLEVHLCFLVTSAAVTTSAALETNTVSLSGTAATSLSTSDNVTTTAITSSALSTLSELVVPATSNLTSHQQQQQQMLSIFATLQKQHQQQQLSASQIAVSAGGNVTDISNSPAVTNVPHSMYQNTSLDLANLMQATSTGGSSGGRTQSSQAFALAAALASGQSQKQLTQGASTVTQQQSFGSSSATAGSSSGSVSSQPLTFTPHQKQMTMAALQQTQWQTHISGNTVASQYSGASATSSQHIPPDPSHEVSLRYEEVSIRTIRNCLNLDELIAAAALAASGRPGGPANNTATAAVALLQANPRLRGLIEPAVTRAINELTIPVFERCARITVNTVAAIVRKDFALDPNPDRILFAARQMVRHLAAGMSLTTAREALGMSLVTTLKNIILAEVQSASGQEKEAVQRLAHFLVAEAMHACLAFMQKSVAEKAVSDVERRLEPDVKLRKDLGPHRFREQAIIQLADQQAKMPEPLRLQIGGPTPSEMAVYEEFGRVIPGFAPSAPASNVSGTTASPAGTVVSMNSASMVQRPSSPNSTVAMAAYMQQQQDLSRLQRQISVSNTVSLLKPLMTQASASSHQLLLQQQQQQQLSQAPITGLFDKIIGQIERHLGAISSRLRSTTDPMIRSLRCLIEAVHLAKTSRDVAVAVNVISTMVQSFLEHYRPGCWRDQPRGLETMEHLKEAHMLTLRHMLSSDQAPFGYAWVTSQVTQTWINLDNGSTIDERQSRTASGSTSAEFGLKEAAHSSGTLEADDNKLNETNREQGSSAWSTGWKSQMDITCNEASQPETKFGSIKWNWEAFAELLKVHVVYLSQVDAYLAQEVSAGHPGAISFVIDLLDHFVLPCPTGTAVGAAAAAAASYARSGSAPLTNGPQTASLSQTGSSTGTQTSGTGGSVTTVSGASSSKREFTVLNEYDLWSTLEAMRARVSTLNAALATSGKANSANLTDPLGLRLRLACARVRGLLDLGLLEQSPLFTCPPGCSQPPISALYAGCSQAREFDDPPNLQEKVELLMRNWVEIYQSPRQRDPNTIDAMLAQLVQMGVLPNMDNLTRFLRLATIFVVERALKQLKLQDQQQSLQMPPVGSAAAVNSNLNSSMSMARVAAYIELDAYARLISIVINRGAVQSDQPNFKVILLNKVLGIITGTLLQEHEVRRDWFHPMPFERILIMLFVELHSPSSELGMDVMHPNSGTVLDDFNVDSSLSAEASGDSGKTSIVDKTQANTPVCLFTRNFTLQQQLPLIFCHLLHCLRPERATAFVFSWLEMLAHRWFVSRILATPGSAELRTAYQAMYAQLLVDLLKFLGYFLQNALMTKPIQCLYKATLRLFLVLIHDFPEFVSDYYALFCDVVPSNSIQMRNLILSALPKRGMPSADPVQAPPVDHLASLDDPTGYCMDAGSRLPEPMRRELDAYLATRAPVKLLSELVTMLRRADDVLPPFPPPQFAHHPQQQARHQQALAAYAAALAANDGSSSSGLLSSLLTGAVKGLDKPSADDSSTTNASHTKKLSTGKGTSETSESGEVTTTSANEDSLCARSTASPSIGSSSAAAAALHWGVRATQQLATFGLADGMHYNVELMTNLTLYVCITAIRGLREKGMPLNMSTIAHTPQMDIIQSLVLNLDNEGRYLLLNCMANQLRYPNSHTYYFSYTILYLFSEQSKEQVKEQISRVLMERLIVNRPHPWGLLMTSAELLRNPAYRFWEHEFARCNPEIESIVTIVARSCIPNFQIPSINPSASAVAPGLRNALSSSVSHGRRQASPLTRGVANVGTVHPSNIPTPLLTE